MKRDGSPQRADGVGARTIPDRRPAGDPRSQAESVRDGSPTAEAADDMLAAVVRMALKSINRIMAASQRAGALVAQGRPQEAAVALGQIEAECERCAHDLREGFDLARLQLPEPMGGVNLTRLLSVCAEACSDLGDVRIERAGKLPLVRGQPAALKRMFLEILDNSFALGARNIVVSAAADQRQHSVHVELSGDGPGAAGRSPGPLRSPTPAASEPFDYELGLAMAARIAAAYGGEIGVAEPVHERARVWVRLAAPES